MSTTPTPTRRRRRRLGAGALAVVALAVSSCSASGAGTESVSSGPGGFPAAPTADGAAYLSQAAASTQAATTLKVAIESRVSGVPGMDELTITGGGEIDRKAERAHLTVDAGAVLDLLPAMGGDAGDGTVETVIDGDTVYLRAAFCGCLTDTDKPWVSMSLADLPEQDLPSGAGSSDPTSMLELLEEVGGPLTEEGTEAVRGVETRHVSTVITVDYLAGRLEGDSREAFDDAVDELGVDIDALVTMPVHAWVDADGRIRRFSLTFDFGDGGGEVPELADAALTVTYELYDFDVPVDIAVPDPSQVAPLDLGDLGDLADLPGGN